MSTTPTFHAPQGAAWRRLARALLAPLLIPLVLGGCASGGLVLHNVGSTTAGTPPSFVNATAEQVRQGLRISREGQALDAEVGMALATGDVVQSLANTVAVIRFPDGHEAILLPGTRVRLGSLITDFGEVFVRVFQQVKGQFKVKTRYVTAGVEGTTFWVRVDRDDRLTVGVTEGRISLSSVDGRWQPVPVLPDEVATVLRDAPPTKAQRERDQLDTIVRLVTRLRLTPPTPRLLPRPPS